MNDWNGLSSKQRRWRTSCWIRASGHLGKYLELLSEQHSEADQCDVEVAGTLVDPAHASFPPQVARRIEQLGPWFIRGKLPIGPILAVVGTRSVDFEGERLCKRIVSRVAAAGVAIASGGAIGVDSLAHEAAVRAGAPTVVFLPAALDRLTPRRNRALFEQIVEAGGALVSEYPPGVSARRFHFHRRNHLIAAFADAVLVVRSKAQGGTLITARAAISMGTPLLVVPGSPEDCTAAGCNLLLRDGARCVSSAAEVLEDLDVQPDLAVRVTPGPRTSSAGKAIQEVLAAEALDLDQIICRAKLDVPTVMAALTELELSGQLDKVPGGWRRARG